MVHLILLMKANLIENLISTISDLAIAFSAIVASRAAWLGLRSWRKDKTWETHHDLANKILIKLFIYRDSLAGVRDPAFKDYDLPVPPNYAEMSREQISYFGESEAYKNRWEKVGKVRSEMYADLISAEVFWGNELRSMFKEKLYSLESELLIYIRTHLKATNPDEEEDFRKSYSRILRKRREIIYDDKYYDDGEDEFSSDVSAAIAEIENYIRARIV